MNKNIALLLIWVLVNSVCFAQEVRSLDEIDNISFQAKQAPFEKTLIPIELNTTTPEYWNTPEDIELNGVWQMVEGGYESDRLTRPWEGSIKAEVPGSVHAALWKAGKIPDPYFGRNDSIANKQSFKTWWFKKDFNVKRKFNHPKLVFGGVAVHCTIWLNGHKLGEHEGMFGGPEFDVTGYLKKRNTLIVKIEPAPFYPRNYTTNDTYRVINDGWRTTVVFNNVYGWHYSNIPSLGIWRPVTIQNRTPVEINSQFIATRNTEGEMNLEVALQQISVPIQGELRVTISPENFEGNSHSFSHPVYASKNEDTLRFIFKIPNPKLWWPNGLGESNLYRLKTSFLSKDEKIADVSETVFGIRTIEMAPLPGGPYPDRFNWTFVINGEKHFIKGTGWCTMDPLMNFSKQRYDRFLSLARQQHIQMLRAWGCGMPETDEFYDLCNRYGILVLQEWPTAWNSHLDQPYDVLEETVKLNTIRIRNNPSLAMYGGGNESRNPFGKAIDMMGRYSIELDGTRPFHRGEPYGGSRHDYTMYWGGQHPDITLKIKADFWGETGVAAFPIMESVLRYLPESEKEAWPPHPKSVFAHHTPVFNQKDDLMLLDKCSEYVMPNDNIEHYVAGSLLAQVIGVRHLLEHSRSRWPYCTGTLYYKMNDNYPAASWSSVDWYGAPKPLHYFVQDAFAPIASVVLFEQTDLSGKTWHLFLPVYLLDDTQELKNANWEVNVRAYNSELKEVQHRKYRSVEHYGQVNKIGEFLMEHSVCQSTPLFVVSEVKVDGKLKHKTFYFMNFEKKKGCLFELPQTSLITQIQGNKVIVKNTGAVPAVAVNVQCPGKTDRFTVSDNLFWLDPEEEHTVETNITDRLVVNAWNVK